MKYSFQNTGCGTSKGTESPKYTASSVHHTPVGGVTSPALQRPTIMMTYAMVMQHDVHRADLSLSHVKRGMVVIMLVVLLC